MKHYMERISKKMPKYFNVFDQI
uniref:Uncharacterized protein n=1 Tax=Anguilla anguilla TaxID=7936 RepID=A0A0E9TG48_ANGAN